MFELHEEKQTFILKKCALYDYLLYTDVKSTAAWTDSETGAPSCKGKLAWKTYIS